MPVPRLLPEEGEPKVALFAAFWAETAAMILAVKVATADWSITMMGV